MWPLPKVQYEQICLALTTTDATVCWISSSPKNLSLQSYSSIAWNGSWPTLIKELNVFVQKNNLHHALLNIALAAPLVHEQLVRFSTASPSPHELITPPLKKMHWDYRYLHTLDDGQSLFYVCGIARPTLFAQQLLAQQAQVHLMNVSSSYMALVQSYRTLFGSAFRRSQLALDLITHNYALEKSISNDSIARLLQINPALHLDLNEHKVSLLTMIGLFNQERVHNGTNKFL